MLEVVPEAPAVGQVEAEPSRDGNMVGGYGQRGEGGGFDVMEGGDVGAACENEVDGVDVTAGVAVPSDGV